MKQTKGSTGRISLGSTTKAEYDELVGQRIRRTRETIGFTQTELGKLIDRGQVSISHYESGKNAPSMLTLARLAKALRIEVCTLIS